MTDDERNENPQTMVRNLGEDLENVVDQNIVTLQDEETPSAPNFIENGMCNACDHEVDTIQYSVQCFNCKILYHAVDCFDPSYCVIAKTSFTQHFRPALEKTGPYENRFGKFFSMCDGCCTEFETKQVVTQDKRVDIIDKKMDNIRDEFRKELSEIKQFIISSSQPLSTQSSIPTVSSNPTLPESSEQKAWTDPTHTKRLFEQKIVVVKKSESQGKPIDSSVLRKTCVDNGIQIIKSFARSKDDIGLVVNSETTAKTLVEKLKISAPEHNVTNLPSKSPTINVVGIPPDINKETLKYELFQQNPVIKHMHEQLNGEGEGKFAILSISPLKNNSQLGKASIAISNSIREHIANACSDRLFLGNGTCKVYDNFHVKRCFNCQKYGHIGEKCNQSVNCGYCAGPHETRSCELKQNTTLSDQCCSNCKNSSDANQKENCQHTAYSVECPIFKAEQAKLKRSIPFYQRK